LIDFLMLMDQRLRTGVGEVGRAEFSEAWVEKPGKGEIAFLANTCAMGSGNDGDACRIVSPPAGTLESHIWRGFPSMAPGKPYLRRVSGQGQMV
jgi:hypothetical protein